MYNTLSKFKKVTLSLLLAATTWLTHGQSPPELQFLGRYETSTYDAGGTEITAFDAASKRLFSVNGSTGKVDIINFANPATPTLITSFDLTPFGLSANSVAAKNGIIAIGVEAVVKQDSGKVVLIDANGTFLNSVTVGALPDMITFTPNGQYILVACEGEPNTTYTNDPEGSVGIINISGGVASATLQIASFAPFNSATLDPSIRKFGPGSTLAQDLEPEYIAISDNSLTAWVTCQENNAWAIIDIPTATVTSLVGMGFKDHSIPGNGLDASDQNGGVVNITTWPIKGMYQPDAITAFTVGGQNYIISANEGDVREYTALNEASRLGSGSYLLDPTVFPNAATLKNNSNLGRLNVTTKTGDIDNDGDFDVIHSFGARSFSIWNAAGALVWDSGDQIEQLMNTISPANFNCSNTNNTKKNRSDDKGPEPEAVTVAQIGDSLFAFVGLERIGGVMIYNITNPNAPTFSSYINTRNFAQTPSLNNGGDLGPEGIIFIPKNESPNGKDLLVLSNEISGTISIYQVGRRMTLQILHASDFEASVDAVQDAPRFAAIVDTLEHTYPNTLILSSGDNILPSPFSNSGEDPSLVIPLKNTYSSYYGGPFSFNDLRAGIGRVDMSIMNFMGIEAAALGNHEFDLGTSELRNMIAGVNSGSNIRWFGTQFPYLSANLNFSGDVNLSNISTNARLQNTAFRSNPSMTAAQIATTPKLAPSCIITKNGQKYGIVGATTPILASISSPGATSIKTPGAGTNDMSLLATILQPVIDSLRFAEGCDKIIILAHMQQLILEKQLATFLHGVDIIVSGGSHTLMADATDRLRAGDVAVETYPFFTIGADSKPIAIINTEANYKYVGRLVIDFDITGNIIPSSVNSAISGAYPADSLGVEETWGAGNYASAFTPGSKGDLVKILCDATGNVIAAKDGNIFGKTAVYLEGRRTLVRTEETNLGNLSSEANLWMAKFYDAGTTVSIKNGGGIRSSIGYVNAVGSIVAYEPPQANPTAGKLQGDISQLDIENSLRFNNQLSVLSLTASGLRTILEHGVRATSAGATPGQFPQVAGVRFSYDPSLPQMARIRSAVIVDSIGNNIDTLVSNGITYGDTTRIFRVVTLNFLASGGDSYPFNTLGTARIDLPALPPAGPGLAGFTIPGSEQDAFAEYMKANFTSSPYAIAETMIALDSRIENLQTRQDDILPLNIIAATSTDGSCFNDGSITLTFAGGSGPYSVALNGGSPSPASSPYTINGLAAGSYSISVTDFYGNSATTSIDVLPAAGPGNAGAITGTAFDCVSGGPGAKLFYIAAVPNADSYNWTWSGTSGVTISLGNGTNVINLSWASGVIQNGITGVLTVTPLDSCGLSGAPSSMNIGYYSAIPVTPGSISGPNKVCPGDVVSYSVASVNRAAAYNWTLPATFTIVGNANSNVIQVAVGAGFNGGSISVGASNSCGNSPLRTRILNLNTPTRPGIINGPASGVCNQTGVIYSTPGSINATSYNWITPAGVSINSGQGSTSINVDFDNTFVGGSIIVEAINSCGASIQRALSIIAKPERPVVINGSFVICPGATGVAYDVQTVYGAASYNWVSPTGTMITSGQGTKNITVDFGPTYFSGQTIKINVSNACGTSFNRVSNGIFTDINACTPFARISDNTSSVSMVYPNPANDDVTIAVNSVVTEDVNMDLIDITGKSLQTSLQSLIKGNNNIRLDVSSLAEGLYFIRLKGTSINESLRITVKH